MIERTGRQWAALLLGAALSLAPVLSASAQLWGWRDANGRMVFSDRPPPVDVKPEQVFRQPRDSAPRPPAAAPTPAPAATTAGSDAPAPAKKAEPSRAELERKAAEEQANKQRIAEDCSRLRSYVTMLSAGQRVARPDGRGGMEVLDDAGRAQELARAKDRLERGCKDVN